MIRDYRLFFYCTLPIVGLLIGYIFTPENQIETATPQQLKSLDSTQVIYQDEFDSEADSSGEKTLKHVAEGKTTSQAEAGKSKSRARPFYFSSDIQNPNQFIDALKLVDESAFGHRETFRSSSSLFTEQPELFNSLMQQLLDVDDPDLRKKLSLVLSRHTTVSSQGSHRRHQFLAENWAVSQIELGSRQLEWLGMLKNWGVKSPTNAHYLLESLSGDFSEESTFSKLWATNQSPNIDSYDWSTSSRDKIQQSLLDALDHDSDRVRIAASLLAQKVELPEIQNSIVASLEDRSEAVRTVSLFSAARSYKKDSKVTESVLRRFEDLGASQLERDAAQLALHTAPLTPSQHERWLNAGGLNRNVDQKKVLAKFEKLIQSLGVDTTFGSVLPRR